MHGGARRPVLAALAAAAALATAIPATAAAQDPAPNSPEWFARDAANFAATLQRPLDRLAQGITVGDTDPRRALDVWSPARGRALETRMTNRYGASIAVTMFRPNADAARPLPTVIFIPGYGSGVRQAYHSFMQDLAEHGYLALVFDPQGQGASDATGRPETCGDGPWREPQEMGLREQGPCAGQPPSQGPAGDASGTVGLLSHAVLGTDADHASTGATYRAIAPTFVLGALDVTDWLLSDANPWRAWVDPARLGIAGHSAGAYGAAQTANGDPRNRFRAAVAFDGYHPIDLGVTPRVPTMWVLSEQTNAPRVAPPANPRTLHPTWASYDAFKAAGLPTGHLVLRSSTHLDFADAVLPASRDGGRYAGYFLLAWFDRFLRGDRSGTERLFAERYDDSVDVSSIGTGGVDAQGRNVPPKIGGRRVADGLSLYYPGALAAFGSDCKDLRVVPCAAPAPDLRARIIRRRKDRVTVGLRLGKGDLPPVTATLRHGRRTIARRAALDLGHRADERRITLKVPRSARRAERLTLTVTGGDVAVRRTFRPARR